MHPRGLHPALHRNGGTAVKRVLLTTSVAVGLLAVSAAAASAAWLKTGTGSGRSQAGTLSAPGVPTAPAPTATSGVTLSWPAATLTDGSLVKYFIERATVTGGVTGTYAAVAAGTCSSTNAAPMTPASATSPSCTDPNTTAGSYKYRVTSAAGTLWRQLGNESAPIIVPTNATITISAPANNGYTNDTTPTVSGTASTSGTVSVKVCPVATPNCSATAVTSPTTGGTNAWSIDWTPALTGDAQYIATATQANGASATRTFTIDTTVPTATISTRTRSNSSSGAATGTKGAVAADATHSADGTTITATIYSGSNTSGTAQGSTSITYPTSTTWSLTYSGLTNGQPYTMVIVQTDGAGNSTGTNVKISWNQ